MFHARNRFIVDAEEEPGDPLAKLVEGQGNWTISTVSALYDLKYTPAKLKQYASKIKRILSCSINESKPIKYNVTIEQDESLKKNEHDPCALSVIVSTKTGNEPEITSYVSILMSWGVNDDVPLGTHLPYMLERGSQQIGCAVKLMLTKLFDCCITPVVFTKEHMILFAIKFCQMEPNDTKDMKFFYKLPDPSKGTLTMSIDIQGMLTVCESVENSLEDPTAEELVTGVYIALQRHVFLTGKLDMSMLELCKVSHPRAAVGAPGAVTVKSPAILDVMLTTLNHAVL